MPAFAHTPYADGVKPFAIGLSPIDLHDWIEVDERLGADLTLKADILAREGDAAFAALEDTQAAQAEVLDALAAHLSARFPHIYRREGASMRVASLDREIPLTGEAPLLAASRLVQEDLLLMRRDAGGWRLVAGSLCFPSTWVLAEKMGLPMADIHAPVPDFAGRMEMRIARIFDHLQVDAPVERFNLSIYGDAQLRHSQTRQDPLRKFPPGEPILDRAHLRVERQTLRKLAVSGTILFTVRIHVDALADLPRHPRSAMLAGALHDEIASLNPDQIAYKGLVEGRDRLLATLRDLAGRAADVGA